MSYRAPKGNTKPRIGKVATVIAAMAEPLDNGDSQNDAELARLPLVSESIAAVEDAELAQLSLVSESIAAERIAAEGEDFHLRPQQKLEKLRRKFEKRRKKIWEQKDNWNPYERHNFPHSLLPSLPPPPIDKLNEDQRLRKIRKRLKKEPPLIKCHHDKLFPEFSHWRNQPREEHQKEIQDQESKNQLREERIKYLLFRKPHS